MPMAVPMAGENFNFGGGGGWEPPQISGGGMLRKGGQGGPQGGRGAEWSETAVLRKDRV